MITVRQLRAWLDSLPADMDMAHVDGCVASLPNGAKRVVAYRWKDGSGAGIVVNPMGTHLSDAFFDDVEIVDVLSPV